MTTYAEGLRAMTAGMRDQLPTETLAVFHAEQRELAAAGPPAGVARPGTPLPDGELLDVRGAATSLTAIRAGRPAVVVFYRGAWCPYCNLVLRTYQRELVPALAERGVPLIAVSPQRPDGSLTVQQTHDLTFDVVSDPGNQVAGALGILTAPTDDVVAAQAALGVDVAASNADRTRALPMPTTLIVDESGVIRWIDVHSDYSTRTEPAEILNRL